MKNKKHKIFLYPVEENGMIKVLLFQSGDIGDQRGILRFHNYELCVSSVCAPATNGGETLLWVNGSDHREDFKLPWLNYSTLYTKEQFQQLKELERAYNNR